MEERVEPSSVAPESRLSVRRLAASDFAMLGDAWSSLLADSDADPLFMGWPWLYSWWEQWGNRLGLELALLAVYQDGNRLVGLAPCYLHQFRSRIGFCVPRLQFLGNAWRIQGTVRTEYSGLIIKRGLEVPVSRMLLSELFGLDWHELVICDQDPMGLEQWQGALDRAGLSVTKVPRSADFGVRIPLNGEFKDWLSGLGRNTRLKAYNRRCYLARKGTLQFRRIGISEAPRFLELLNGFHSKRWGRPCFDQDAVHFHLKLMERLGEGQLALSILEFDGEPVSVLYDVKAGGNRYNLQAGFLETFDRKVALGTLHLGYAVEESFQDEDVMFYDLLAGYGKNSFYKSRFHGETVKFLTMQYARHPVMRSVYRLQSLLPVRLRQRVNRLVGL